MTRFSGLDHVLELSTDLFLTVDQELRVLALNANAARLTGRDPSEISGRPLSDVFPSSEASFQGPYLRVLNTGVPERFVSYFDSLGAWYEIHVYPFENGLSIIARDSSDRIRAEEALRESERRLRLVNEAGRALGSTLEPREVFRELREFVREVLPVDGLLVSHYTEEDNLIRCEYAWVDGKELDPAVLPPIPLNPHERGMQSQVIRDGQSRIFENVVERAKDPLATNYVVTGDGLQPGAEPLAQTAMMVPVKVEGKVAGVVQAMCDRAGVYQKADLELMEGIVTQMAAAVRNARLFERAQKEINDRRMAEARLSVALKNARISVYHQDLDLRYTWFENPLGPVPQEQILGKTAQELADPETAAFLDTQKRQVLESGRGLSFEMKLEGTDGSIFTRHRIEPLRSDDGAMVGLTGAVIDVSEQRKAEEDLRRMNEELEQRVAERTAALEAAVRELEGFTYSVSHDLRAPLRAINATSAILRHEHPQELSKEAIALLERQALAAHRMGQLIDELLKLSRLSRQSLSVSDFDISALAWQVVSDVMAETGCERGRFKVEPGCHAKGDPIMIRFVLLNLLQNAVKFSPHGGEICFGKEGESYYVKDHGIGFDMAYVDKIFQPFERLVLDHEFPGTGIGLANVKRIVERHGGKVWAESEPGKGATFYFTLG